MMIETKQSEQIRRNIETQLDSMVIEIAKELKSCFERRRDQTISDIAPYFDVMAKMSLVHSNPIKSDIVFGREYKTTQSAREMYTGLVAEWFYKRREFLTF